MPALAKYRSTGPNSLVRQRDQLLDVRGVGDVPTRATAAPGRSALMPSATACAASPSRSATTTRASCCAQLRGHCRADTVATAGDDGDLVGNFHERPSFWLVGPSSRKQQPGDPSPGVRRVDHVVELERGGRRERLAMLIGGLDQLVEQHLAFGQVLDRGQFLAEPQPDRALETHAADLPGRPGNGELRRVERTAGHRHCAQPVTLSQNHHPERHGQPRADDEEPAEPPDRGVDLGIRADHEARCVAQRNDRQPKRFAQRQEIGQSCRPPRSR